jgi:hypothetical protein
MTKTLTTSIPIKKIPINRNNLFYSKEDFDLDLEIGKDYIEQDMNQTVILYQVDRIRTNSDVITKDAKKNGIRFKPPVEIHCVYHLFDTENKAYNGAKNLGYYKQLGHLEIDVYQATLDELKVEIILGDYIGLLIDETTIEYFEVNDDGRKSYSNKNTMYGYQWFWRKIKANTVDKNQFNGI